jgi:hypothetical protein
MQTYLPVCLGELWVTANSVAVKLYEAEESRLSLP